MKIHDKNMTKLKEEFKDKSETYEIEISELRSSTKVAEDKNTQIAKKLDIAQNVIVQLKEKIDEKDVKSQIYSIQNQQINLHQRLRHPLLMSYHMLLL